MQRTAGARKDGTKVSGMQRVDQYPVASKFINEMMEVVIAVASEEPVLKRKLFQANFQDALSGEAMVCSQMPARAAYSKCYTTVYSQSSWPVLSLYLQSWNLSVHDLKVQAFFPSQAGTHESASPATRTSLFKCSCQHFGLRAHKSY